MVTNDVSQHTVSQLQQQDYLWISKQKRSQDLHRGTSYEHPRRSFIQTPMQRIFKILLQGPLKEDFNSISIRSSGKDLCKIMRRPWLAFHQDPHKNPEAKSSRQETHKIVIQGPDDAWAGLPKSWYENFPEPSTKAVVQAPRRRGIYKATLKRTPPGTPQDPVWMQEHDSTRTQSCQKSHLMQEFQGNMPPPKITPHSLCEPAQSKCAWTCHKSNFRRKITGKKLEAKWSTMIKHDQARVLALTVVRTPVWTHCLGNQP